MRYALSEEMFGEKCKVFVHKDGSIDLSIGKYQKLPSGNTGQWIEYGQMYIEPHRPKGKWIMDDGVGECSHCHWLITAGDEEINNYCPHCGADMR